MDVVCLLAFEIAPCPGVSIERNSNFGRKYRRTATTSVIGEKLKVEKSSTSARETGEDFVPSTLAFVAMGELNMCVLQWNYRFIRHFE